tara:strand:- start:651 stop:1337 length:687 start_codon:yes stop_codon:yes gene_type:complete
MTQEMQTDRQALLYGALAKAQGAMSNPDRNRTVTVRSDKGNYSFDYATLDNIIDTARKALSTNGISVVQMLERDDTGATVMVTRLLHSGGGMIMNEMPISLPGPDDRGRPPKIQELGSIITYARRYAICAMLNIAAEEDDDGNSGTATAKDRKPEPPPAKKAEDAAASGTREAFKAIRDEILAAKDAIGIADVILRNKAALLKIKETSEAGYSQLIKLSEDRAAELKK